MKQLVSLLVLLLVCHVFVALADQTEADCGDQCQQVTYARPLQGALVLPKTSGNVRIVQPEELEQLSRHPYESSAPASVSSSSSEQQQAEQVSELSSSSCHPTVQSSTCCEVVDHQCCHPCSATSEQPTESEAAVKEAIDILKEQETQLSAEREAVEKEREEISEQRAALESSSSSSNSEQQSSSSSSSSSEQESSSSSSNSEQQSSSSSSSSSSAESSQAAESALESAESAISLHSQTEESLSRTIEKLTEEGQDERQRVEGISARISHLEVLLQELSTEEAENSNDAVTEAANEISDKFKLLEVRLASMETRINIIEKGLLARAGAPATIVAGGNVIQGGRGRKPHGPAQDVDVSIAESLSSAIEGSSGESSSAVVSSIAEKLQQYSSESSSSQVDSVVEKINQALEKLESSGSLTSSDAALLNEALSSNSLSSASSASASSSSASSSEQQQSSLSSEESSEELSASAAFLEIGNPIRNLRDQISKHRTA